VSSSWESRLEAARKARAEASGEGEPAASRDLPPPPNATRHPVRAITPLPAGFWLFTWFLVDVAATALALLAVWEAWQAG